MKIDGDGDDDNPMIFVPTASWDVPRDTGVPEIVMPGPPGVRAVPAMRNPVGLGVKL